MASSRTAICNYRQPRASGSSNFVQLFALLTLALVTCVTPAAAQDTTRTSRDSLAARLERAEEAIAQLKQKAEEQSSVQSRSRMAVEINGRVLVNAFSNTRRVNNVDVPTFVRPDSAGAFPAGGGGMAIRQTTLGISTTADNVFGGTFAGALDVDFFGGQQPSSGGRTFPLVRMRIARGSLIWKNAEVMVGQESPLMSGLNPVSLAAVGIPGFTSAGNLWLWLPQLRVTLRSSGDVRFGVAGAVLAPTSGDAAGLFDTDNDVAERSRRPFVEGRAHVAWGMDEMAGAIGVSAHGGWFAKPGSTDRLESMAFGADAKIPLASWLELRGEWFSGDGMRALGGGAIGQLLGTDGNPLKSTGGWAQVNLKPTTRIEFGAGYGFDDPDDDKLGASARRKNVQTSGHLHLRPAGPIIIGLEYRRLQTTYASGPLVNDHFNVAVGFVF
jgi:putative intracellular protease/amidase